VKEIRSMVAAEKQGPSTRKRYKRLVRWLVFLALLYLALDRIVMPVYTRHGQAIAVPDVTNLDFQSAKEVLESRGLRVVRASDRYDAHVPPGHVVFQEPRAGSQVKKGRRIYLTISKGEKKIPVPNLVGGSERDARFRLGSIGLNLQNVDYTYSSYYPEGVVVDQSIPPQTEVELGTGIRITVSLGPAPSRFMVPDVVGKSLDDAIRQIRKAGLTPGTIRYQPTSELLPETVLDQSIPPGQEVSAGDTLDLVVSQYPTQP
jgi:serine/threonine-protein kinase